MSSCLCCLPQAELRILFTALGESKRQLLQRMAGAADRPASKQIEVGSHTHGDSHRHTHPHASLKRGRLPVQTLSEVEDGLRDFEQRVSELRARAEGLQADQVSNQELLKLQVTSPPTLPRLHPSLTSTVCSHLCLWQHPPPP